MSRSLEDAFRQFCSFGDKDSAPLMDGAKFAKMCRDVKLLDKKLTATDVDIIFTKAKPKTERKLTLEQFEVAVKMLAEKKYPGDPGAMGKMQSKLSSGPTLHPGATKVAEDALLDRMTDTSKYTGSHKLRFDESGKGKGLEGRESVAKGPGHIPPLVSEQPSYVTGNLIGLDAVDTARAKASPKTKSKAGTAQSSPRPSPSKATTTSKPSPRVQSKAAAPSTAAKASPKPAQSKPKTTVATSSPKSTKPKGDIYDRLTDSSSYTGSHKHRFDETGRGKGLQGRDAPAKGAPMNPPLASNLTSYVSGYKHESTYGK